MPDRSKLRRRHIEDLGRKALFQHSRRFLGNRYKKLIRARRHLEGNGQIEHRAGQLFKRGKLRRRHRGGSQHEDAARP